MPDGMIIMNGHEYCSQMSDDSRFCLESSDRRVRVIRRLNERYAQCNILGRQPYGGDSVMVWDGFGMYVLRLVPICMFFPEGQ
jgi:hypothetical protein